MIRIDLMNDDRSVIIDCEGTDRSPLLYTAIVELFNEYGGEKSQSMGRRRAWDWFKKELYELANDLNHYYEREEDDDLIRYKIRRGP